MPLCNQVEYAKHRGLSVSRVNTIVKQGVLKKALRRIGKRKKPFIESDVADRILDSGLEPDGPVRQSKRTPVKAAKPKVAPEEKKKVIATGKMETLSYAEARTMHERFKAAIKKLQFEEKSGTLILAENVQKQAFSLARQVRDAILNIPDRIAPILAAEKDEKKVKELIEKELRLAMEALSGGRI